MAKVLDLEDFCLPRSLDLASKLMIQSSGFVDHVQVSTLLIELSGVRLPGIL